MQKKSTNLPLDFATVYHCAIKPFKNRSQKLTVCALLTGKGETKGKLPMSDAVCSNYINGKRAIPDDCRNELAEMTIEELSRRLNMSGIHEYEPIAESLCHLVENAMMQKTQRNKLLTLYKASDAITFINEIFHIVSDVKSTRVLTPADVLLLGSYTSVPTEAVVDGEEGLSLSDSTDDTDETIEDVTWMKEFVPVRFAVPGASFFGTPITINRCVLSMPKDYSTLVKLLKPALVGSPIDSFEFEDFAESMGIGITTGKVEEGSLRCWQMTGPIEGIASTIEGLNLSNVSDVTYMMRGRVTLTDDEFIKNQIRQASNPNVNILRALCFDSRLSAIELTLIVRVYPAKAAEQRQNIVTLDAEGVRVAEIKRKKQR